MARPLSVSAAEEANRAIIWRRAASHFLLTRIRRDGKAWVYRSAVAPTPMIRREIRRFLDGLFGGEAEPLVAHLAEMDALSLEDLRELERAARQGRADTGEDDR